MRTELNVNVIPKRILSTKESASILKDLCVTSLDNDKVEDITVIDLSDKADFAYFMIIATGRSSRHVSSSADKLVDNLLAIGLQGINIEGKSKGDWVLVDARDVVIHIMRPEARSEINLENMWKV